MDGDAANPPSFGDDEKIRRRPSLTRVSNQQNRLNPALKPGDIQVAVFEEIVKGMKESATSNWDDIVFIPPGFEVSTEETKE
ncbi:hypothetical protein Bca52824_033884 [Brassica carinata]|uniref:Uncharacterized protein n=1 Tax=Brassica carinata TaxID=52824 RepID=A0A8X7SFE8_BRACI|nr:hypothetical protein Bca52824_033884 [Brassica carinata]